jgi:cobalt-zinc-cadmium resistance protein CzcA
MLNRIIGYSIHNKLIIGLFTLTLILFGSYQLTKLPIDAVPDITNNQVQIITVAPSYSATDIERLITIPVEQNNQNISGIQEIRSFSRFGLSLVTIVFKDDIDIYWARQQVAERLQKVQSQIPTGIGQPELAPVTTGLGEIYQYVVRPEKGYEKKYSTIELRTIQDWNIRRQLLGVEGVVEVSSFGGKLKQYEVAINSNKLHAFNLSIDEVFTALEKNNQNTGGSYIEKGPSVLFIKTEGLLKNISDIENIVVKNVSGIPVYIKNIAEVKINNATRYGAMCYNDKGETAGAVVMMLKGANSSHVIENVKSRIELIKTTLPKGITIEPFLDRTKMVNNAINTVEKNLMEGALIVVFILVLFLGNLRAGLIVASVIPLSMLIAVILMNLFGVSGNLMSLGALDFGLIVDGAVIIVEAVMHQLSYGKKYIKSSSISQEEMNTQVEQSASKMMNSAIYGQLIILIVYLPIFTLEGIEGKMFKPMAQTVAFALIGAFLLSITYVPMMSSLFINKKINHNPNFSDRAMFKIEKYFQSSLSKILRIPKIALSLVALLFISALYIITTLGGEFIPALEEGDFAVEVRMLTGSNLQTVIKATQQASKIIIQNFPEVEKVVTKIGSGEIPTDPMPIEAADLMIILKDKTEWTSAKSFPELAEKMSDALKAVPGITTGFQFPVQMRFNELMTGARQDVVCKIYGENIDSLAYYAQKIGNIATKIEGAEDIYVEPISGMPQVIINYKREVIAQYGLNIEYINNLINTAYAGQTAGYLYEGEKKFNLTLKLDEESRKNEKEIKNLLVPLPNGNQIPLNLLADIEIKMGPNQIQRENTKRRIIVGLNIRNKDVQSVVLDLQKEISKKINLSAGYQINYGGSFENLNAAKNRLMIAVPVSLLLIFLMLYFAFKSIKQGLLIYTAIPLSAIGGILFLALRNIPFSISAGVGFIALFGVAVLNGIVLIAEFNKLQQNGYTNLLRVVLTGSKLRLRPVLMTAFVASLGFLPMAVSNGAGAEVQRPLATVVIGGLLIATFLTLFLLPLLYIMFEKKKMNKNFFKILSIVTFTVFTISSPAQSQTISLKNAIDSALANNLKIKNQLLFTEYKKKLAKSTSALSPTNLSTELGQINSAYIDSKIGISQSFYLPNVYLNKQRASNEEINSSLISTSLTKAQVIKNVRQIYYQILILNDMYLNIKQNDSLYNILMEATEKKLKSGDINIVESKMIEIEALHIKSQLKTIKNEIELSKLQFQLLLNCRDNYEPEKISLKMELGNYENLNPTHPLLKLNEQQIKIAKANLKAEKSTLFPEISAGYFNQSINGMGADNKSYFYYNRFHFAQISLGLPLFYGGQKSKIKAAQVQLKISENEYVQSLNEFNLKLKSSITEYLNQLELIKTLETLQIPNIITMSEAAGNQFKYGEINYLEWSVINSKALEVKNTYYQELSNLNQLAIELKYLTEK